MFAVQLWVLGFGTEVHPSHRDSLVLALTSPAQTCQAQTPCASKKSTRSLSFQGERTSLHAKIVIPMISLCLSTASHLSRKANQPLSGRFHQKSSFQTAVNGKLAASAVELGLKTLSLSKAACAPHWGGQRRNYLFIPERYACVFYMFPFSNPISFILYFFSWSGSPFYPYRSIIFTPMQPRTRRSL